MVVTVLFDLFAVIIISVGSHGLQMKEYACSGSEESRMFQSCPYVISGKIGIHGIVQR